MGCSAGATTIVGCPPPPTRPFVGFVFGVFKMNMSSSLGLAAAAAVTVCLDCVAGGLDFSLTIEAQDLIE